MPRYDYRAADPERACEHCRGPFEVVHGMMEDGPDTCPECGAPVRRVIHAAQIKSSRWSSKRLLNKDNLAKHGFKTGSQLLEEGGHGLD